MSSKLEQRRKVLCPIDRDNRPTYWMRVGNAWENADGTTNIYLDVLPKNGRLYIRRLDEKELERINAHKNSTADASRGASDDPF